MELNFLSGMAKVFEDEVCGGYRLPGISCLKNETAGFIVETAYDGEKSGSYRLKVSCSAGDCRVWAIKSVPAGSNPLNGRDDCYLRDARPGLYPDVLDEDAPLRLRRGRHAAFYVEFRPRDDSPAGIFDLWAELTDEDGVIRAGNRLPVRVSGARMPERKLGCTMWFHSDCLAAHYGLEVFSEEYFACVRDHMLTATEHGINTILTPLFTPPLDTAEGTERPTVQLVGVKYDGKDYSFDFSLLDRWLKLAFGCGYKYVEFAPLFTQWGARHAPKIYVDTPDGVKRIFGWETDSAGREYTRFLVSLAGPLKRYIEDAGIKDAVRFHTSDEPSGDDMKYYRHAAELMHRLFPGYVFTDAMSDPEFAKKGLTDVPVASIGSLRRFADLPGEKWTYYCCGPVGEYLPNRFIQMPSFRSRALGYAMYKAGASGFLQWGYNFYFTQLSLALVDPYLDTEAGGSFPAGDAFVVYPGERYEKDGGAAYRVLPSLRLKVFRDALNDCEKCMLLEERAGRAAVEALIDEGLPVPYDERNWPHSEEWFETKREIIDQAIEKSFKTE